MTQTLSLTRSAGLLGADPGTPPGPTRPALAQALLARRADLAALVARCVAAAPVTPAAPATPSAVAAAPAPATVGTLRDAAALLSVYGTPATSGRLLERVEALIAADRPLPVSAGLLLASWLHHVPGAGDDLVRRLITSALANARTTRDLDAYEALPGDLRTSAVHDLAGRRAAAIIGAELAALAAEPDPDVIRETAADLAARSRWYGHDVHINALLDRADGADLSAWNGMERDGTPFM
jgi:hypothetical protein